MMETPRVWDPNTQPRTRGELQAMLCHAIFVRRPHMRASEIQSIAEAILIGIERYGLAFRRTAWKPPEGARLETRTLADIGMDEVHLDCSICPREETHSRRHLMDRFNAFRPAYEVPRLLSLDCEKRKLHGPNWCRFNYARNVKTANERNGRWMVRQEGS